MLHFQREKYPNQISGSGRNLKVSRLPSEVDWLIEVEEDLPSARTDNFHTGVATKVREYRDGWGNIVKVDISTLLVMFRGLVNLSKSVKYRKGRGILVQVDTNMVFAVVREVDTLRGL